MVVEAGAPLQLPLAQTSEASATPQPAWSTSRSDRPLLPRLQLPAPASDSGESFFAASHTSFRDPDWPPLSRPGRKEFLESGAPSELSSTAPSSWHDSWRSARAARLGTGGGQKSAPVSARTSKQVPGALAWLYREPTEHSKAVDKWMESRPSPERSLRRALRQPLSARPTSPAASGEWQKEVWREAQAHQSLLLAASRCVRSDAPLLAHGRRRLQRLQELAAPPSTAGCGDEADASTACDGAVEVANRSATAPLASPAVLASAAGAPAG
eukprot:TRINITY_DN11484_c0_g3_i1.p1 TRINITY_DN11484_c0_g3~~TRINITY_DN11484_c0_g3_i1.p1  ORF type:complete len:270 (+),score=44.80 TRINITY_DN11484_c0_g3_i1:37-846(+)